MTHRLTLICHGATAATRLARFPLDEPLDQEEAGAATALGPLLRRADLVRAAPALRTMQTAEALALDAPILIDEPLRDLDAGNWAGRALADIGAAEPNGMAAWIADPESRPHGGESLADLAFRVAAWLDERLADRGHTVAVTHASVLRAAVLAVLGAPLRSFWRIDAGPLAAFGLSGDGNRWTLRAPTRMTP